MKVSYNWLNDYLDLSYSPERLGEILTALGLEVEGQDNWVSIPGKLEGIVVGHVLTCGKHPNADKLSITTVDIGEEEPVQIVCGAPNVAADQFVLVSTVGTTLYPNDGEPFKIKKGKIRGEVSMGMICAEDEIGLGEGHDGILVLDKDYKPGTPASEVFPVAEDIIYEVGLTPNRSDATNHRGVAADLRAYLTVHENSDQQLRSALPDSVAGATLESLDRSDQDIAINVEVLDGDRAPRYAGLVLTGIKVGPSPEWLKNRLAAIGVRSINNVVDATNFILHDLGQPLHAFDLEKVADNSIRVRTLPTGTVFTDLNGDERMLNEDDLMICDGQDSPMCIGGVFGGIGSGVTDETNSIFLESAFFEPRSLRRTSTRHLLFTDAARTFEKGVDPNITVSALVQAAALLQEVAGAKVASNLVDLKARPIEASRISFRLKTLETLGGIDLDRDLILRILDALDFTVLEDKGDLLELEVSTNRADVVREADVVEEVLRVYGYDNVPLPSKITLTPSVSKYPSAHQVRRRVANYLIGQGLNEAMGLSLVPSKIYEQLAPEQVNQLVRIHNTSTVELDAMRTSLIPTGLQAITHNQNRQRIDLQFFEFGKGYLRGADETPAEFEQLAIWTTGRRRAEHWTEADQQTSYAHVRGLATGVLSSLGLQADGEDGYNAEATGLELPVQALVDSNVFAYAQHLMSDDRTVATIGRVAPAYLEYFDTKTDEVYLALIHWSQLTDLVGKRPVISRELSRFPIVRRDLALVVDKSVSFGQIVELTAKPAGKLVKSIELFDVFEDAERLGENKRSYAIRYTFERLDRTLKDKEVDKAIAAVTKVIDSQPTMEVRR